MKKKKKSVSWREITSSDLKPFWVTFFCNVPMVQHPFNNVELKATVYLLVTVHIHSPNDGLPRK